MKKYFIFFFLIFFQSSVFAVNPITEPLAKYLRAGGYSDSDIDRLIKMVAEKRITIEEVGYRLQLGLVGYSPSQSDEIISMGVTIEELENRLILRELGYDQKTIEIIMLTSRVLKKRKKGKSNSTHKIQGLITTTVQKRLKDIYPFVVEASKRFDVDQALILAVIHQESSYIVKAVSPQGASGLMQLMDGTARDMDVKDVFNARDNILGGTRYLKWLMESFGGDLVLVLAAYNSGPGLVAKLGRVPKITETIDYVEKVTEYYEQYLEIYPKS